MNPKTKAGGFAEERQVEFDHGGERKHRMKSRSDVVQGERDRLRAGRLDLPPIENDHDERLRDCRELSVGSPSVRDMSRFSELWLTRHEKVVHALPHGHTIVVDYATGHYVTDARALDAMDRFDALFGKGRPAWMHDIGIPITLGSGLWALSSEA